MPYTIVDIVAVNQSMVMSLLQLISLLPNITSVAKAGVVGKKVFDLIERSP